MREREQKRDSESKKDSGKGEESERGGKKEREKSQIEKRNWMGFAGCTENVFRISGKGLEHARTKEIFKKINREREVETEKYIHKKISQRRRSHKKTTILVPWRIL